jgi:hypothetical protein
VGPQAAGVSFPQLRTSRRTKSAPLWGQVRTHALQQTARRATSKWPVLKPTTPCGTGRKHSVTRQTAAPGQGLPCRPQLGAAGSDSRGAANIGTSASHRSLTTITVIVFVDPGRGIKNATKVHRGARGAAAWPVVAEAQQLAVLKILMFRQIPAKSSAM